MIKLRVVGASEDHDRLILSNKPRGKGGSHAVVIDRKLLDVLQEAVYARREAQKAERLQPYMTPPREEPKIAPREIQRQLRAGASPAQIAKQTDLSITYIEKFLQPVVYERIEVVNEAQELRQEKPRLGPSGASLGESLAANLASRHVRMDEEQFAGAWSATRKDGEDWVVTFTFPFRGRSRVARWRYDPRARAIAPANKYAAEMGWIAPGKVRPVKSDVEVTVVGAKGAKKASASKASTKRKPAARKPAARKPAARKAPVKRKPASKKKAPAKRKPAARKAPAKRKPAARKAPARRAPAKRKAPASRKPAARKAPVKRKPAAKKKAPARRSPARRSTAKRRAR